MKHLWLAICIGMLTFSILSDLQNFFLGSFKTSSFFAVAKASDEEQEEAIVEENAPLEDLIEENDADIPDSPIANSIPYVSPNLEHLLFAETFDNALDAHWFISSNPKFAGKWEKSLRKNEALVGDYGLKTTEKARHYAISRKVPQINNLHGQLYVSYEAQFQNYITCGGAYMKLFNSKSLKGDMNSYDNETPYIIMFGPDKCGQTDKIHMILKYQNPVSKEWTEHHLEDPPAVPQGSETHQFGFLIKPDDTYVLYVDNEQKKAGSMFRDFTPPIQPPEEIDDPADSKPLDWVDAKKIPDPNVLKPDEWDESEPPTIDDPDASIPEGWLIHEAMQIPDTSVLMPKSWNVEEDGEWEPPMIDNPKCDVGCGPWTPPQIKNPKYKGVWTQPMIDNPDYKGEWQPRKIKNPNYYEAKDVHKLGDSIDAIGFELWTMDDSYIFDNIVLHRGRDRFVDDFISQTFLRRQAIEKAHSESVYRDELEDDMDSTISLMKPYKYHIAALFVAFLFVVTISIWRFSSHKVKYEETAKDKEEENENKEDQQTDEDEQKTEKKLRKREPKKNEE